jgi:hypothetical protein
VNVNTKRSNESLKKKDVIKGERRKSLHESSTNNEQPPERLKNTTISRRAGQHPGVKAEAPDQHRAADRHRDFDMSQVPQENTLKEQMRNVLEEARMVLPGIQALFGFQAIAVFNQHFDELGTSAKMLHLAALTSVVIAVGLVMMPAAWHRIVEPTQVSETTVAVSSRLISSAMLPLAFGIALDIYVVFLTASDSVLFSGASAIATFLLLLLLWFVIPFWCRIARHR